MDNNYILQWIEEKYPDRLPTQYVDEFNLGILIGQRQLIEDLKVKLKVSEEIEITK